MQFSDTTALLTMSRQKEEKEEKEEAEVFL
jgi:hypothetical protein